MKLKTTVVTIVYFAVIAALLFGSAGTLTWPGAWAFLVILCVATVLIDVSLLRHDPELLAERMKVPIQRGQPGWDKVFITAFLVLFVAWLPLMGLDAVRFGWSDVPAWLQAVGSVTLGAGLWIAYLALRENSFDAPVVRVQAERGHRVISTGPYARVRHPLYSGAALFILGTALLLGSWYGLAVGAVLIAGVAVRAVLEERTLAAQLDGYVDYRNRVRHRLVPGVW
jgi:protein-S-isoprenylcysteine O-methyltransferase Ste14